MRKKPRKTAEVVYNEEALKRKSIDQLKEIAKLRGIKNGQIKRGLITSLLKSEISNAERNYVNYFDTNASNNDNSNNTNNDSYDGKIRDKISDIRAMLSRLRDIITKNDRVKIKKELYEIKNKKNLSDKEKETIDDNLLELKNKLNKKKIGSMLIIMTIITNQYW